MNTPKISIVAPIYRSKEVISELVNRIFISTLEISENIEIILVEDGCPENSWLLIAEECNKDSRVKGVKLSRNFGQQIAVSAGLSFSKGDYVIIMDGDLQNPPESISVIYNELMSGIDLVNTISPTRNNWRNELTSKMFWWLINTVLKVKMVPNQLMMKGMSRRFVDTYNLYQERIRIVAGITHDIGLKSSVIVIQNQRRKSGRSNYNFWTRLNLMIDIVLSISTKPLSYLINISLFSIVTTSLIAVWNLLSFFIYADAPAGYMTLLVVISFFGSFTLLALGIIGKYLASIYTEVRNRPIFLTQEKINFD
jgi:dolichol-phosphate mannosyltransferase